MNRARVMITGLGAITSTGHSIDETWQALVDGRDGIDDIAQWDLSTWPCHRAGEIKAFNPAKCLPDRKLLKAISRQDVLGINAAMQAIDDANIIAYRDGLDEPSQVDFNEATGVYVASPGNKYLQQYDFVPLTAKTGLDMQAFADGLFDNVHPMWLLRILPNNVLAYTGIQYGFKGANHNVTNHVVGGAGALIEAYHAILSGQIERAVVIGYDVGHEPQGLYYYTQLGVISPEALRPFDRAQNGTILAEGAAALVLEREDVAIARGAKCYAEFVGAKVCAEGTGLFGLDNDGSALSELIGKTLAQYQVSPQEVGTIVAHGNGNPKSDVTEAAALERCFGGEHVNLTAFKWSMGHTLCAASLLDTALMAKSFEKQQVPVIANLTAPIDAIEGFNWSSPVLDANKPYALIDCRGFGGFDGCMLIKQVQG